MKLHCPHCGVEGSADDSYSGLKVKCPKCQGMFEVQPELPPATSAPTATGQPFQSVVQSQLLNPIKISCPHCGVEGSVDESSRGCKVKCPKCQWLFDVEAAALGVDLPDDIDQHEAEIVADLLEQAVDEPALAEIEEPVLEPELDDPGESIEKAVELEVEPERVEVVETVEAEETVETIAAVETVETVDDSLDMELQAEPTDESLEDFLEDLPEEIVDDLEDIDVALEDEELPEPQEASDEALPQDEDVAVDDDVVSADLAELAAVETESFENLEDVQQEPYGVAKEQCWQCGKESDGESFTAKEGRLYCLDCLPEEIVAELDPDGLGLAEAAAAQEDVPVTEEATESVAASDDTEGVEAVKPTGFSIGGLFRRFLKFLGLGKG